MSIQPNFASLLGNNSDNAGTKSKPDDRPKAQVWANIGYLVTVPTVEDPNKTERVFVSLQTGIPIDNLEPLDTRGKKRWANFQHARNQLAKKLADIGMGLNPGDTCYFPQDPKDGELAIELRRVGTDTVPDDGDDNIFLLK